MLTAQQYFAETAVMLIHSFSPTDRWFEDFAAFANLVGVASRIGELDRYAALYENFVLVVPRKRAV